jgi:hypothetical protein
MFRRVLIQDASGNLLESFENYNDLYCLTELLSDSRQNREGFSAYHGEGLKVPGNTVPIIVSAAAGNNATSVDVSPFAVNANAAGSYQFNGKYPTMNYPSLGGAIIANYAMGSNTDVVNPTESTRGSSSNGKCNQNRVARNVSTKISSSEISHSRNFSPVEKGKEQGIKITET